MEKTATLLVSCPDRKGIIEAVTSFLLAHNANILHANQHLDTESNLFLMRLEWDVSDFSLCENEFLEDFKKIAKKYDMDWRLKSNQIKNKVAIMVSQYDHCLADLLHKHKNGDLDCQIVAVLSNHVDAEELVNFYEVPFYFIKVTKENKIEAEQQQNKILSGLDVDLIILARYMQILSPNFIKRYPEKIINIHHSFLPAFVGAKPYHRAHERGVKLIGATSHYVTEELDGGPIIEQDIVRVSHHDQITDLTRKGRDLERVVLSRAIRRHIENRILIYANKTVVFK
ncbi:MAG: formyltetrahydrofolate deformylase [Porticoccus sp.]|jgi:formyltetrahydrofolate deformylase|nr:formyltetrahydrofolate deformylase [Porticoccus sp.]|tara:strand:- start:81 stop:935 length:855 start_codon:yes stop_codon:yes gene_type:complete